jgi:hypothetical protein
VTNHYVGPRSEAANGLNPGGVVNEKVALVRSPPVVFRERHLLRGTLLPKAMAPVSSAAARIPADREKR